MPSFPYLFPDSKLYISGICPTRNVDFIGIQMDTGYHFNYFFNHKTLQFEPLKCLECQKTVHENSLQPIYSVYSHEHSQEIIFCRNLITFGVEQYILRMETGGFEQVDYPEVKFDEHRSSSEIICVIPRTKHFGTTIIRKDFLNGGLEKLREVRGNYVLIPPIYVKALVMKELESDQIEYETVSSHLPKFIIQFRDGLPNICALQQDLTYSYFKFYYDNREFVAVEFEDYSTESDIFPKYGITIDSNLIILAYNQITQSIEQYEFCEKTQGFEQVDRPEIEYDPSFKPNFPVTVETKEGVVSIGIDKTGRIQKTWDKGEKIQPVKVVNLKMKRAEEERWKQQEKKLGDEMLKSVLEHGRNPNSTDSEALLLQAINGKELAKGKVSSLKLYLKKNCGGIKMQKSASERVLTHYQMLKNSEEERENEPASEKSSDESWGDFDGNWYDPTQLDADGSETNEECVQKIEPTEENEQKEEAKEDISSSTSTCTDTWESVGGEAYDSDIGSDISILEEEEEVDED
ncbi:unnamed protein product [Caenorhabditis brenneri]